MTRTPVTTAPLTPEDLRTLAGLEITTTRRELAEALATVGTAIAKRPAIPVLAGVHLEGHQDGTLTLTGFDYDTAITVTLEQAVTNPGRCLLNHAELVGMLAATAKGTPKKKADTAHVTVAHNSGKPTVTVDGYTLPLTDLPREDYPLPDMAVPPTLTVDAARFVSEVARVVPAAGGADALPVFANVHLVTDWSGLTMTATDGYRAARAKIPGAHIPEQGIRAGQALVEAALLRKLVKHLPSGTLTVGVHEDRVMLSSGPVTVVTRTSDQEVIAVDKVVPESAPMAVTVDRQKLAAAIVKATNILGASAEGRGMSLSVIVSPDTVAVAPKIERVIAPTFPADTTGVGEGLAVHFNPKFLAEAVGAFAAEDTVALHLTASDKIVMITAGGEGMGSAPYWHMLQPVRVH
ncbi:DNA polymerase III subunit beta [Nocardiopsis sp. CT-R113]|uniref:DNA polymerase III subunit beta n=1 Tax=Nocardiopsis codii TaxID=3065942 RepID=A0ABU7KDA2_9ACTN|nr:DNA polymerase III subunit beta [Nocardiopsis sp. CT-R113]MEE2040209.1 DNA polymerase III subunit beta [Nocardiopsis sp. CT-R113]